MEKDGHFIYLIIAKEKVYTKAKHRTCKLLITALGRTFTSKSNIQMHHGFVTLLFRIKRTHKF